MKFLNAEWHSSGTRNHAPRGARRAKKYSPRRTTRTRRAQAGEHGPQTQTSCEPLRSQTIARRAANDGSTQRSVPRPLRRNPKTPARTKRRRIDGEYVIEADGSIGFRIGPHDPDASWSSIRRFRLPTGHSWEGWVATRPQASQSIMRGRFMLGARRPRRHSRAPRRPRLGRPTARRSSSSRKLIPR